MPDKAKLTVRQVLLIKNLTKGMTIADAARQAGYSEENPRQVGSTALAAVREKMPAILDKHGLTQDYLVDKCLRPLMDATETKFFQKDGKITDEAEVIAWGPRKDGLDMAFKLRGDYAAVEKNGDAIVNVQINTNVQVPEP